MNCQNCHSVLPQSAVYCARCGTSQNITPLSSGPITQIPFPSFVESGETLQPQIVQSSARYNVLTTERQEHEANAQHEEKEEKEEEDNERLMVFSDGIIAFALTVAAITIKIPSSVEELQANSLSIWLRIIMYIIAFIIVISAWADHHTIFHHIKRNNVHLVVLNFLYLAALVMFPIGLFFTEFGLELSNSNPTISQNQILLGLGIFLGSQMLASLTLCRMWLYSKNRSHLLDAGLDPHFSSYITKRLLAKPLTFLFIVVVIILNYSVLPHIAFPVIAVAFIARAIYFRRLQHGIDLTVGTNDTQRIQLFSDAVIGIAITLSVAQIEFPTIGGDNKNALEAVNNQWPLLHAFMVGIVIIGVYWLFHYHLFRFIKRHDTTLIFLNNFFLLTIALMLIPINWFVNYYNQPNMRAPLFFGLWQILTSLVLVALWRHASHNKRLLAPDASPEQIKQFNIIVIAHPVVFLVLTIISGISPGRPPSVYIVIYLGLIIGVWFFSQRLRERRAVSLKVAEQSLPSTILKQ